MLKKILKWSLRKFFWGAFRHILTDKQYAKIRYWLELDRSLNLKNPQRFTEKIQYIKLYQRSDLRHEMADRRRVRTYVDHKTDEDFLVPFLGNYKQLTPDIWQTLPNQFVLKANHGCGMLKIVTNKDEENYSEVCEKTKQWQRFDYARYGREWAYKDLPRSIIAEQLLLDSSGSIPKDYKFFCFDGCVKLIQVDFNRFGNQKRNLYDHRFNKVDAELLYPNYTGKMRKPGNLKKGIEIAEKLSADFNFLRVDLYLLEDHIYFGELTNYPGNGFVPFEPESMEYKMGSLLQL